jgi:hypothetical protein
MLLAHGPTDISDHLLLDSILTNTFCNRFGLILACHWCEEEPTFKSYCCDNSVKYEDGHYKHFMETLSFAVSGKDSTLEIVSNEFTTASIIEKHITKRSPVHGTAWLAVQVAEKALRAKKPPLRSGNRKRIALLSLRLFFNFDGQHMHPFGSLFYWHL